MEYFDIIIDYFSVEKEYFINIYNGIKKTSQKQKDLQSIFNRENISYPGDEALVFFGSLARNEMTNNSDVDWTYIVDGQVDAMRHIKQAVRTEQLLQENDFILPSQNGAFGKITFSHDLVHFIGGQKDSNFNLTQRVLLLLESWTIDRDNQVYQRIIKAIIYQYLENDSGYRTNNNSANKSPKFLFNNFVRYWRTICVDFANKQILESGKKSALRNFKLRMSRKLIFLKGILICDYCFQNNLSKEDALEEIVIMAQCTPIELVVLRLFKMNNSKEWKNSLKNLLMSYDSFLGLLNDDTFRKEMNNLEIEQAYENDFFIQSRQISKQFDSALKDIFFNHESELKKFIIKYGII